MNMHLGNYAHFTNEDDLDNTVKQHRGVNKQNMNDMDDDILEMIRRHSVKAGKHT